MSDKEEIYVVVEDEEEKSFSVMEQDDIVCDEESVKLGDKVTYFWKKQELKGIIRFVDKSHKACRNEAQKLQQERKKQDQKQESFDEDKPRRAATRFMKTLKSHNPVVESADKKKKAKGKKNKKSKAVIKAEIAAKRDKIMAQELMASSGNSSEDEPLIKKIKVEEEEHAVLGNKGGDDQSVANAIVCPKENYKKVTESSDSSSSIDSVPSDDDDEEDEAPSEKVLALKLAKQLAMQLDVKDLLKLSKRGGQLGKLISGNKQSLDGADSSVEPTAPSVSTQGPACLNTPSTSEPENAALNPAPSASNQEPDPMLNLPSTSKGVTAPLNPSPSTSKQAAEPGKKTKRQAVMFTGQMLRFTEAKDGEAVELLTSKFFCRNAEYEAAEKCGSTSVAVRHLLIGVFTDEALSSCSVTGLPPRGKGREAYVDDPTLIRPALKVEAVNAIIAQGVAWQLEKRWKPKREPSYLRSQLSVRLCEWRNGL